MSSMTPRRIYICARDVYRVVTLEHIDVLLERCVLKLIPEDIKSLQLADPRVQTFTDWPSHTAATSNSFSNTPSTTPLHPPIMATPTALKQLDEEPLTLASILPGEATKTAVPVSSTRNPKRKQRSKPNSPAATTVIAHPRNSNSSIASSDEDLNNTSSSSSEPPSKKSTPASSDSEDSMLAKELQKTRIHVEKQAPAATTPSLSASTTSHSLHTLKLPCDRVPILLSECVDLSELSAASIPAREDFVATMSDMSHGLEREGPTLALYNQVLKARAKSCSHPPKVKQPKPRKSPKKSSSSKLSPPRFLPKHTSSEKGHIQDLMYLRGCTLFSKTMTPLVLHICGIPDAIDKRSGCLQELKVRMKSLDWHHQHLNNNSSSSGFAASVQTHQRVRPCDWMQTQVYLRMTRLTRAHLVETHWYDTWSAELRICELERRDDIWKQVTAPCLQAFCNVVYHLAFRFSVQNRRRYFRLPSEKRHSKVVEWMALSFHWYSRDPASTASSNHGSFEGEAVEYHLFDYSDSATVTPAVVIPG